MKVNIQGLKNGSFEQNENVFFENTELKFDEVKFISAVQVSVHGEKNNEIIRLSLEFSSDVEFPCDRCLEPFVTNIKGVSSVIFTKKDITDDEGEIEIIRIDNDVTEIDLHDILLEELVLSFPMKRIHAEDCKGICSCGVNLNLESCRCEKETDPRWEALEKLKRKE
jgi:uncharacterized protein